MGAEVPVRVFARPRPREVNSGNGDNKAAAPSGRDCIELHEEKDELWLRPQTKEQQKWCPTGDQNFVFDGVLPESMGSQEVVYSRCAAKVVTTVLDGYNGTIMAYGQTGAGKTYTMSGKVSSTSNLRAFHDMSDGPDKGIMQRVLEHVYKALAQKRSEADAASKQQGAGQTNAARSNQTAASSSSSPGHHSEVALSYIEIYNDVVHDLLQEDSHSIALRKSMMSYENPNLSPSDRNFPGVSRHITKSRDHAMELLHTGLKRRQVASHNLNRDSSRSHAIFTLYITQKSAAAGNGNGNNQQESIQSRLDLVDLAGSERLSKSQSSGVHQSEAQHINKSLSFLEQVVLAIGDPKRGHIPYRTCKLTQYLKDSLGGNSYTVFIANVRLENAYLSESLRTCRFSQRMLNVKNSPILNVMRNDKNISQYIQKLVDENNHLKEELALYDSLSQVSRSYDPYNEDQRSNLYEQLLKYFNNDSWSVDNFYPLEFSSVRHIKEIILQCKALYRNTNVPRAEGSNPHNAMNEQESGSRDGGEVDETQISSPPSPSANRYATSDNSNGNGYSSYESMMASPKKAHQEVSEGNNKAQSGSVLDPTKIEAYKAGQGKQLQEALDENRMLVRTKKKESNMLAKQMNELIKRIKSGGGGGSEDVQMLKGEYRELHQERAVLLSEIEHCQRLVGECSKQLVEGVNSCLQ